MRVRLGPCGPCYVCGAPVMRWQGVRPTGTETRVRWIDEAGGWHSCPPAAWDAYYARHANQEYPIELPAYLPEPPTGDGPKVKLPRPPKQPFVP